MNEIPNGWKVIRLQNVLKHYQNGNAFSASDYVDSGIPIVTMANISLEGKFQFFDEKTRYWVKSDWDKLERFRLGKGNLIVAMTDVTPQKNLIGRMAIIDRDRRFFLNQRVGHIIVDETKVIAKYLAYYSNFTLWRSYSKSVASLGVQANMSTKDIKLGKLLLPPLEEQRAIADILGTWDEAIALTERLIDALQERKKGLMQKLLTGEVRFSEFDGEWEEVQLGEIAKIIMGQSPSSDNYNDSGDGYPLIQGNADIQDRKTAPRTFTTQITKLCQVSDIILSVRAPVGETALSYHDAVLGRGVCAIRPKNSQVKFLYQLLLKLEPKWDRYAQGSTFKAVNSTDIRNFELEVPQNIDEQRSIGSVIDLADKEIEGLHYYIGYLQQQKKGLMQQLLTGQVRVNVRGDS